MAEEEEEGEDEGLLELLRELRVQSVFIEARGRETRCICAGIEWVVRWNQGGSGIQVRGNKIQTLQSGKRAAVGKNK